MRSIAVVVGLGCLAGMASATSLGVNLVVNGDANAATTPVGWALVPGIGSQPICITTAAGQATTAGLPPGVTIGVRSFWGCGGATTKSMSQLLDVSDLATQTDLGRIEADWATLLQSRQTDRVTATLSFLDAASGSLGSRSYIDTNGSSNGGLSYGAYDWSSITDTFALPAGTRYVNVGFVFTRPAGTTSTDSFVDNVSLALRQVAVVPEPGTWALLSAGLALTAAAVRRRRG